MLRWLADIRQRWIEEKHEALRRSYRKHLDEIVRQQWVDVTDQMAAHMTTPDGLANVMAVFIKSTTEKLQEVTPELARTPKRDVGAIVLEAIWSSQTHSPEQFEAARKFRDAIINKNANE